MTIIPRTECTMETWCRHLSCATSTAWYVSIILRYPVTCIISGTGSSWVVMVLMSPTQSYPGVSRARDDAQMIRAPPACCSTSCSLAEHRVPVLSSHHLTGAYASSATFHLNYAERL